MDSLSSKINADDTKWSTTEVTLTPEEEGTIVTLVVVVVGILAAIIFLFSMGIFIDCRTHKNGSTCDSSGGLLSKRNANKRMRLQMPPFGRINRQQQNHQQQQQKQRNSDSRRLADDMCPNGLSSSIQASSSSAIIDIDVV